MKQLIALDIVNYRSAVGLGHEMVNYALISIGVPEGADYGEVSGEMILVLDRSGSMEMRGSDGKLHIHAVIDAAMAVAKELRPHDRMGVVVFDDNPKLICPLTAGGEKGKAREGKAREGKAREGKVREAKALEGKALEGRALILSRLEDFRRECRPGTGGGTELCPALRVAMKEIHDNARDVRGARLVILTDGQLDDQKDTLDYVNTLERQSIGTMGFGSYDLEVMNKVCEPSKGLCTEVGSQTPTKVKETFFEEMSVAQNTVATNLRLVVRATPFVRLRKAYIVHPRPTFLGSIETDRNHVYRKDLQILERNEGIKVLLDFKHVSRDRGRYSAAEVRVVYDVPSLNLSDQEVVGNIEIEYTDDQSRIRDVNHVVKDQYDRAFDEETRVRMEEARKRGDMEEVRICLNTLERSTDPGVSQAATAVKQDQADPSKIVRETRRKV